MTSLGEPKTHPRSPRVGHPAHEVADGKDFVNFFPSLASDITAGALDRELQLPKDQVLAEALPRLDELKRLRPYSGGGRPFVEPHLIADWQRSKQRTDGE